MTTIQEIYVAINPLPAILTTKGKKKPEVEFSVEANAGVSICLKWIKFGSINDWDWDYKNFLGDDFAQALAKALEFIEGLPSAKQAKLHAFMGKLGQLIDEGKDAGIEVDYLNPLLDSMKRLSENVITYQPKRPSPRPDGGGQ